MQLRTKHTNNSTNKHLNKQTLQKEFQDKLYDVFRKQDPVDVYEGSKNTIENSKCKKGKQQTQKLAYDGANP